MINPGSLIGSEIQDCVDSARETATDRDGSVDFEFLDYLLAPVLDFEEGVSFTAEVLAEFVEAAKLAA